MATIELDADVFVEARCGDDVSGYVLNCDAVALTVEDKREHIELVIPWTNISRVEVSK